MRKESVGRAWYRDSTLNEDALVFERDEEQNDFRQPLGPGHHLDLDRPLRDYDCDSC
jgi:hypothetical protein